MEKLKETNEEWLYRHFKTVTEDQVDDFVDRVNEMVGQGWSLITARAATLVALRGGKRSIL